MTAVPDPHTCICGWDVEFAQVCTATPGVLHPAGGDVVALCPPERGCTDAVMHRAEGTGWHTRRGSTVAAWYAQRQPTYQQLTLEAA